MLLSIWDDGYGISVPEQVPDDEGRRLEGARRLPPPRGRASRPRSLRRRRAGTIRRCARPTTRRTSARAREHVPAILHVTELTQPLGHSTSGSHERYKTPERLQWEREFDCLRQMRKWIIASECATRGGARRDRGRGEALGDRRSRRARGRPIARRSSASGARSSTSLGAASSEGAGLSRSSALEKRQNAIRKDLLGFTGEALLALRLGRRRATSARSRPSSGSAGIESENRRRTARILWSEGAESALQRARGGGELQRRRARSRPASRSSTPASTPPSRAIRGCSRWARTSAASATSTRASRTCRRSTASCASPTPASARSTIVGQAIGMALRGLRPIAEIQYLDYLLYALQIMSDDLASLRWRTAGGQKAPVIIRTRGHRLEGIWHAGSPMARRHQPAARHLRLRAARRGPGRRLLQHHAAVGRPGADRRGPQRLPAAREGAGQPRRDDHSARRAGDHPRRHATSPS